ncbi:MAG TPA: nitroreductase family protein, partial [Alphaproteobacteria bacterium]|nr:nitroreductase family protein [Alphaproteobacteria bacterium]
MPAHLLGEPVPEGAELTEILATAMRAPDHGALTPWRFLMVRGAARERLGELFAAHQRRRDPAADAAALEKARAKPLRAPLLIGVWAEITPDHPKAPEIEQVVATAAAAQNVLNALHARGYGGILLTGGPCYDDIVKAALGL